ncbi:uncharacterized protein MONBRDRAFT_13045 [Monosiga brevicollis MX1]|uniref:Sulfotransferase domain-containing protein n=1 Tax=Monosiga brevicollis TaxID=81824 RepID=A9VE34_MONBE|nr:uncharacterized protein MONBRDRAFT_13045 [Monosiga brevicollis MX1]EDQ84209.1 predicted protein [Monosiga brevicollis MX1]|eukprot:XP_001750997.1 hypothetical protein [Monosiga brevicollis MX1]
MAFLALVLSAHRASQDPNPNLSNSATPLRRVALGLDDTGDLLPEAGGAVAPPPRVAFVDKQHHYHDPALDGPWAARLDIRPETSLCAVSAAAMTEPQAPHRVGRAPTPTIHLRTRSVFEVLDGRANTCASPWRVDAGICFVRYRATPNEQVACLPSFIIVGAMKAGTAEAQGWLGIHPNLYRWKGLVDSGAGEAKFFSTTHSKAQLETRWQSDYLWPGFSLPQPSAARDMYTFEKTPRYMVLDDPHLIRMHEMLPSLKLVALLRHPSARAYSHFQHRCRRGTVFRCQRPGHPLHNHVFDAGDLPQSLAALARRLGQSLSPRDFVRVPHPCTPAHFEEIVTTFPNGTRSNRILYQAAEGGALRRGHYAMQLRRLYQYYRSEDVLVLLTEEMFQDFVGAAHEMQRFMGLPFFNYTHHTHVNERGFTVLNDLASKTDKAGYEPLGDAFRARLDNFFLPWSRQLIPIVGQARLERYWKIQL